MGVPAPSSPSGQQPAASAPDGSSLSAVPNAGDFVIWRDWGLNVREVERVTAKLIKLKRGGYPGQIPIGDKRVVAIVSDYDTAIRLKDSIAGVDGEFNRRRQAADDERNARVSAASDARDRVVARLIRDAQAIEARRAETGTGSVHESAVAESDAPNA